LFARYDLKRAKEEISPDTFCCGTASLWRYKTLLPIHDDRSIVTLGEGMTPLLSAASLGKEIQIPRLMIKDEGINPTGTFKARGAAVGVSKLKELGTEHIVMTSSGNAGAAWATYCRRGGLHAHIFLPCDASESTQKECAAVGGDIRLFAGHISRGGKLSAALAHDHGWFEVNTMKEPYRLEGKKTMGYEIAEQLGWEMPDVILYPTGGGVGLVGIWKALGELEELGFIRGPRPKLVGVQYAGCAPLAKAFRENRTECEPWGEVNIIPGGMRSTKPFADYLVLQAVRETHGTMATVSIDETFQAWERTVKSEGVFCSPEGATTVAAAARLRQEGFIRESDRVVVLFTATGLKYTSLIKSEMPVIPDE
jgi:threonine synthase